MAANWNNRRPDGNRMPSIVTDDDLAAYATHLTPGPGMTGLGNAHLANSGSEVYFKSTQKAYGIWNKSTVCVDAHQFNANNSPRNNGNSLHYQYCVTYYLKTFGKKERKSRVLMTARANGAALTVTAGVFGMAERLFNSLGTLDQGEYRNLNMMAYTIYAKRVKYTDKFTFGCSVNTASKYASMEHYARNVSGNEPTFVPPCADLRPILGKVKDQGENSSTCVADACAVAFRAAARIANEEYSADYLYANAVASIPKQDPDLPNVAIPDVLGAMHEVGVCTDQEWESSKAHSTGSDQDMINLRADGSIRLVMKAAKIDPTPESIMIALSRGIPVIAGCDVGLEFVDYRKGQKPIQKVQPFGGDSRNTDGHCVLIVGYNNTTPTKTFIVRNSWGADWGDAGHAEVAFDYPGFKECWCIDQVGLNGKAGSKRIVSHPGFEKQEGDHILEWLASRGRQSVLPPMNEYRMSVMAGRVKYVENFWYQGGEVREFGISLADPLDHEDVFGAEDPLSDKQLLGNLEDQQTVFKTSIWPKEQQDAMTVYKDMVETATTAVTANAIRCCKNICYKKGIKATDSIGTMSVFSACMEYFMTNQFSLYCTLVKADTKQQKMTKFTTKTKENVAAKFTEDMALPGGVVNDLVKTIDALMNSVTKAGRIDVNRFLVLYYYGFVEGFTRPEITVTTVYFKSTQSTHNHTNSKGSISKHNFTAEAATKTYKFTIPVYERLHEEILAQTTDNATKMTEEFSKFDGSEIIF